MRKGQKKTWVSGPPSQSPGAEVLKRLYVDERKPLAEIGRMYDVWPTTVRKWLKIHEIPTRSTGEARRGVRQNLSDEATEVRRRQAAAMRERLTPESHVKRGKKLKGRTPPNKGKKMSEEQRRKLTKMRQDPEYRRWSSERQKGEKSVHWRGGYESRAPRGWEWKQRRLECYARDNWKCQDCGVKCTGGKGARSSSTRIQAHHIIRRRDGGGDELTNLVTLCLVCHRRREHASVDALFAA